MDQPNVNANASGSVSHLHDMVATALDLMKNDLEKPFREASPLKAMFLFIFHRPAFMEMVMLGMAARRQHNGETNYDDQALNWFPLPNYAYLKKRKEVHMKTTRSWR